MKVYPPRDIRPFVMYCVNGKPRSSLLIESTDSMIESTDSMIFCYYINEFNFKNDRDLLIFLSSNTYILLYTVKYLYSKILNVCVKAFRIEVLYT